MTGRLHGKRALVTGAGKGIGRALVARLVADGATVTALSRDADDLASLARETGCATIACDLADLEDAAARVAAALPIDLLVNNAGITRLEAALDVPMASMTALFAINTLAPLRLAQVVVADLMRRQQGGAIVNLSSIAAELGLADHAAYCASKGALDALTRVMAVEWGPHGIRANTVNPTVTMTPMGRAAWSDPAKRDEVLDRLPLGRFCEPEDIAGAVSFLLSADAAMINGLALTVDGGLRIAG